MGALDGVVSGIKRDILGQTYLRDYTHAAKIFLPGSQSNAPKVKFIFHTYFEINEQAWKPPTGQNYGLLVKQVKLPSFSFDTTELNQYNRKRIIQSKIKYQPIDIVFHDDNASQMTAMWNAYYQYNYADSWNPEVNTTTTGVDRTKAYNRRNIYDPSLTEDMQYGYRGGSTNNDPTDLNPNFGSKVPFFNNITIYGMWQGKFLSYTLINPIITNFAHDTYDYNEGGGIMQNTMTFDYETVIYNTGQIDDDEKTADVVGFADQSNYDLSPSPLASGPLNSLSDVLKRMASMDSISIAELYALQKRISSGEFTENGINEARNGLQALILNRIAGGNMTFKEAFFPTNGVSGTMVNIANQGTVTGTIPVSAEAGEPLTAGQQVFNQAATLVVGRLLGG